MSKQALQSIIDQSNFFAKMRKEKTISIRNIQPAQADKLFIDIDMGMSPENLHCDGEITVTQARKKARNYMAAVKELQKMGFTIPADCYEIG